MTADLTADEIIERLDLVPHPEGGHYAETWRGPEQGERAVGTAIYFLLREGERSHWHRVDATELWLFHAGSPLTLRIAAESSPMEETRLGIDLAAGQRPQGIVPAGAWQSATSDGAWTLVSCTVSPGFEFSGFELAPDGWNP